MSWWIYVEADVDGHGVDLHETNYTSNLAGALPAAVGVSVRNLDGMSAKEAAPLLGRALDAFTARPQDFLQFEPANGWGDMESFADMLRGVRGACLRYPSAQVRVS